MKRMGGYLIGIIFPKCQSGEENDTDQKIPHSYLANKLGLQIWDATWSKIDSIIDI